MAVEQRRVYEISMEEREIEGKFNPFSPDLKL